LAVDSLTVPEFTVTWRKVQQTSRQSKPTNHIEGLFKDFQGLEFAPFKLRTFQDPGEPCVPEKFKNKKK